MPKNKSLIRYFTKNSVLMAKVNKNSPSVLNYIENHIKLFVWRFIWKEIHKGKIDNIRNYKNIHNGKRCFILGNGPSVNRTNLELIKDEIVFTTNQLFDTSFTYYVTDNRWVILDNFGDICKIKKPVFLGSSASKVYKQMLKLNYHGFYNPVFFKTKAGPKHWMWEGAEMPINLERGVSDGATVITGCLQIAYYMGFKKVYLLGCDCDFSKKGHFYDEEPESYKNESDEVPLWFESYKMCKRAYEADGREIINATVGGKLEVFKRQSLEEIMKNEKNDK